MFDRRLLAHFNWLLFGVFILIAIVGIVNIYSATVISGGQLYQRQIFWLVIGLASIILSISFDYFKLKSAAYPIFGASILLLILVRIIGHSSSGAQRWLNLGFVSFQPSEFSKLALLLALSKYFSDRYIPQEGLSARGIIVPSLLFVLPFTIIAKQPDLGTAIVLGLIFFSMLLLAKVMRRTLLTMVSIGASLLPISWYYLKDYQKARLLNFLNPSNDPLGMGYHLIQSKIAIGSGGLFGKGFLHGTQGQLLFLPENHTDFVFSILAEEWGFAGSFIVIILYLLLLIIGLDIARKSKDRFGCLVAFGITSMFFWHIIINIGMVTGLFPVVGVPLPFLSYGGSFILTSMIGVGILLNIDMRRFMLR